MYLPLDAFAPASLGSDLMSVLRWLLDLPAAIFHGYTWLLETAAGSIRDLFDSYGYWVIFLGTLFENTILLGLIIPGVVVVLLAGINAQNGLLSPELAIALGILGTIIGDTISYLMGRFGWTRVGQGGSFQAFTEKVREPILRRGALFVLVYHFAGYTRLVGPTAAGLLRMPYRRWAPADHIGAVIWVSTFIGVGYGLGAAGVSLDSTDRWFRYVEWGLLAFVAVWGIYLYRSGFKALRSHLRKLPEEVREATGVNGE